MAAVLEPTRFKLSAEQYHRMGDIGIFAADARIELIDGEIIEMAPIRSPHAWAVADLARQFAAALGDRAIIYVQNPVRLSPHSEPEPDVMLLAPRAAGYRDVLPGPQNVLLLVEVADTSRTFDFGRKLILYAEHGIAEVWIVDLQGDSMSAFSVPASGTYGSRVDYPPEGRPTPLAFADVSIVLKGIIG